MMNRTQATAATEPGCEQPSADEELASADSRDGAGQYFGEVVREHLLRRSFLKGLGLGAGALAAPALLAPGRAEATGDPGARLTFDPITAGNADAVIVPVKYSASVVIRWGEPILPGYVLPVAELFGWLKPRYGR